MHAKIGQRFPVLKLIGIVEFASETGAHIELCRVSKSGFTRTGVGHLDVIHPCKGTHKAVLTLAIREEYQQPEMVEEFRKAAFAAFGIHESESYSLQVCLPSRFEIVSEPVEGVIQLTST